MIQRIGESTQPIIYIMLNRREDSYPTLPPTLFFSVKDSRHALCPPIF